MKYIIALENVQRRSMKLVNRMKSMSYKSLLMELDLSTLAYRMLWGYMIETYKIIYGIYDKEVTRDIFQFVSIQCTRGYNQNIIKPTARTVLKKFLLSVKGKWLESSSKISR